MNDAQNALAQATRLLLREGRLAIPSVGKGKTAERHRALATFGRKDLALARIVEAHTDAVSILEEAGRERPRDALYGVWAADAPNGQLHLVSNGGSLYLRGTKQYCSGSAFLDSALVTAHRGAELLLVEVPLRDAPISIDTSGWKSPAFADTATGAVQFNDVAIAPTQIVGTHRWYLDRPGFWHGALGPAACWAGGALGLIDAALGARRDNPHYLAHLGALEAAAWGLSAMLDAAGREIDADPNDETRSARRRALSARHLIERTCFDVMDHFGRATGPALLAFDASIAKRYSELTLYIRQCHAERDLHTLSS